MDMLTTNQAATFFGVTTGTIRRWAHRGIIPVVRVNRRGAMHFRRDWMTRLRDGESLEVILKTQQINGHGLPLTDGESLNAPSGAWTSSDPRPTTSA